MDTLQVYQDNLRGYWQRATLAEKRHGRQWYGIARQQCGEIASEHGYSLKRVIYATAVLSNQIDWEQNVDLVYHVAWATRNSAECRGHYRKLLDKAQAILRDGDFTQLRGPKVTAFAACIEQGTAGSGHACIDRWMFRAAGLSEREAKNRCETALRNVQIALRRLACQLHVPVSIVQATIWLKVRQEWTGESYPLCVTKTH